MRGCIVLIRSNWPTKSKGALKHTTARLIVGIEQKRPKDVDGFVVNDESKIKWSSRLKETFARGIYAEFEVEKVRNALYRPFTKRFLFFDSVMNHRRGVLPSIFPTAHAERENLLICVPSGGNRKAFGCLVSNLIPNLDLAFEKAQCFSFYAYNEDGTNRRENISDWSLKQFQDHYHNPSITKWDIFYYVYGLLHHPGYREKVRRQSETRATPHSVCPGLSGVYVRRQTTCPTASRIRDP